MTVVDDPRFAAWNTALARAAMALGTPEFPLRFDQAVRCLVPFDNSMLFAYRGNGRPIGVYDDLAPGEASVIVDDYVIGPYVLDPFFSEVTRGRVSGLATLNDLAPDHFYESEYFHQHYARTKIVDEAGIFMGLPGGVTAVHSVTRRHGSAPFERSEIVLLSQAAPLLSAFGQRHWSDLHRRFDEMDGSNGDVRDAPTHPLETALNAIGQGILTERQSEIVTYILKGHSTESIALHLDISIGTAKVHRRNVYSKLGISSQSELFSIFLEHLRSIIPHQ